MIKHFKAVSVILIVIILPYITGIPIVKLYEVDYINAFAIWCHGYTLYFIIYLLYYAYKLILSFF